MAADSPIEPGMTVAEAMQAIGRACIARFADQARTVREVRAPESVHQARVATRRLRAGMSLFKPVLGDPETRRVNSDLWTLAAELGKARDLDVMLKRLRELHFTRDVEMHPLLEAFERRRVAAYDEIIVALEPAKLDPVVSETTAWIEEGDWLNGADKAREKLRCVDVEDFASRELGRRTRSLRKRCRKLDRLDDHHRHLVRIKAKKVRYGAEFFAPLAHGRDRKRAARVFIDTLRPLQDCLGGLNDIVTSGQMLRDAGREEPKGEVGFAAGAAADEIERTQTHLLRRAERAAADFAKAKFFLD
jgi:CHAD domain-containing protein